MKRIIHKCGCGAEASWEERVPAYQYDENGRGTRAYSIDALAQDFLAAHADCRQAKNEIEPPRESFVNPKPSPDPEECADRRANRANSLEDNWFSTEEVAKNHCQWLARDRSGIFHFYSCSVSGKEHWHVEEMPESSVYLGIRPIYPDIESVSVEKMEAEIKAARQQERERCLEIIDYTGGDSRELNKELILKGEKLK